MKKSLRLMALVAVGMTATALSGCAGAGAAKDPVVFACVPHDQYCSAMAAAFTAETGIAAEYVNLGAGETVARLQAAKSQPEFDVFWGGSAEGHVAAYASGLTENYTPKGVEKIPAEFRDPQGKWTGAWVGVMGFCSNQKSLDKLGLSVPTSWNALLDPKLQRQVAIPHPGTSGSALTVLWTIQTLNKGNDEATFDYFKKLHTNILQYPKSGSAPGQMVGRGEVAVGTSYVHDCEKYREEGMSDIVISFPKEGTGYEVGAVSLVKGAPHSESAKAFIDFAVSTKGQEVGQTVNEWQIPVNPDAKIDPKHMVDLKQVTLITKDLEEAGKQRDAMIARFDREIAPAPKK